ncbi:hypothetical protein EDC04DRAFT_2872897 [Pisolithus marmoratus]|nr:hypothetical protein EDC04DRAFT_2872897 [Pisolithus marmoratus]
MSKRLSIPSWIYTTLQGTPCDVDGNYLPPKTPPPPLPQPVNPQDAQPWHPFTSQGHFELADFLFCREQMSGGNINDLMHIWAALDEKGKPPFNSHSHLYQTIDDISQENSWDCLEMHHVEANNPNAAPWKQSTYQICLHDAGKLVEQQLSNPGLKEFIDYSPQLVFGENHQRAWSNFMTGNWAWNQCNELAKKEENHGAMFVPIILGSDKTVVSVATGNNEYWPLYITTGNVHNSAHCGHGQAVSLLGFLSHLFQTSLGAALETIKPIISTPKVILCADGHYQCAIYGIGPYIADYPEQVLLACIVQGWCPNKFTHQVLWKQYGIVDDILPFTAYLSRANIHELLSPDILHQVIKGTFKDHLVAWVYLPAVADYLPDKMVQAISAFMDFCYIHYHDMIQSFGAPNGLCSSITESKHIQAVKDPWRRTNQYEALYQMLVVNQHLDNLGNFRACYLSKPLVPQGISPQILPIEWNEPNACNDENIEEVKDIQGARVEATVQLAGVPYVNHDEFPNLVAAFVYQQQHPGAVLGASFSYPLILERGYTFDSAIATFHAPSDLSGVGGMQSQRIHATPSWRGGPPRYDCVFVEKDPSLPAQVILLFSFSYRNMTYSCALVRWFQTIGDKPCQNTGMWMVKPSFDDNGDCVVTHLIGIYGPEPLPRNFTHTDSLTAFLLFISQIMHDCA